MYFKDRLILSEDYKQWLADNPDVTDSPFTLITYLDGRGFINNKFNEEENDNENC